MNEIKDISRDDLQALLRRPEDHFFEKKAKEVDGKRIQKTAVAFANADGGDILIGIKDEKAASNIQQRWDGEINPENFNFVFQNLLQITPSLPFTSCFFKHPTNKTLVLKITIDKSNSVHSTSGNEVYQRIGAQSQPIKDHTRIIELSFAKGQVSFEDHIVKDAIAEDIFESKEIKRFLSEVYPATNPIDFTVNQNLIDTKTFEPRVAGILLFNDNPVAKLPRKCGIKITRYDTSEIVPEREHLKSQETVEGSLYNQINDAIEIITRIMSDVNIYTSNSLQKVEYPPEAIWEIVVNAVIHRDYSISDDIQIHIYNNRIEVISPGRLPGYVTVENILEARLSRNAKIVRTLNRYKNPPNKDMGEGLNTAFQKMAEWRLTKPEIMETGNYVKVTLFHTPLASPDEIVLDYLKTHLEIRNGDARKITNIRSENVMKNVFYRLRDAGLIVPIKSHGGAKTIAWRRNEMSVITQGVNEKGGNLTDIRNLTNNRKGVIQQLLFSEEDL